MVVAEKNYSQYKENVIVSSKPEELTLMLYNGLIKFIGKAQEEIKEKDFESAHNTLIKCQDIIFEFQFTLNMEFEVSDNLMKLYDYINTRLIEANSKKDCEILDEVLSLTIEMRNTWVDAIKQIKEQQKETAPTEATAEKDENAAAKADADVDADNLHPEAVVKEEEGFTEIAVSGASVQLGNKAAPKTPSTKAIYSKNARPFGTMTNAVNTSNAARSPDTVNAVNTTKTVTTTDAATNTAKMPDSITAPNTAKMPGTGVAENAANTISDPAADISAAQLTGATVFPGKTAAEKVFQNPFNKINPSVAAQYAKVSKSKSMPNESISIESK